MSTSLPIGISALSCSVTVQNVLLHKFAK